MDDETRERLQADYELHAKTFAGLPGAASLIDLYGNVPGFHDAEVRELRLSAKSESTIKISNLFPDIFSQAHVLVTLTIREIVHIQLDGFSPRNILYWLRTRPAVAKPDQERFYSRKRKDDDLELELGATFGIGGSLVCNGISVTWTKDRRARGLSKPQNEPKLLGQ